MERNEDPPVQSNPAAEGKNPEDSWSAVPTAQFKLEIWIAAPTADLVFSERSAEKTILAVRFPPGKSRDFQETEVFLFRIKNPQIFDALE